MEIDVFIFSNQNSFCNLCENGIDMEVTPEEEGIGPNYMKLVQRFVYLLARVGNNNNNNKLVQGMKSK